ncbi:MAG: 4-(cytidine 5'-diphospho)-2-C-methyl-D-erythritol kinase [Eubacteriaceae bacterium]|nr:4-(cytidine 5'-diphospho)-2-C-methyl-D-erythritol kinase [Eubacteriaceae bacterium]
MDFSLDANAKVNIGLSVRDKRLDGYHNIESFFATISLADTLSFSKSSEFALACSDASLDTGEANTVAKAARAIENTLGIKANCRIHIQKRIPMGAGLGGGSADAAAALVGINRALGLSLSKEQLCGIGLMVGSDVPFFINGGFAICKSRGEIITPLGHSLLGGYELLLAMPSIFVPTGAAYALLDDAGLAPIQDFEPVAREASKTGKLDFASLALSNDFEGPIFEKFPLLGKIKESLLVNGSLYASMTGTGSCVYGIFEAGSPVIDSSMARLQEKFGPIKTHRAVFMVSTFQ